MFTHPLAYSNNKHTRIGGATYTPHACHAAYMRACTYTITNAHWHTYTQACTSTHNKHAVGCKKACGMHCVAHTCVRTGHWHAHTHTRQKSSRRTKKEIK
eukprot:GDKI01010612.1.p2 GENE.GDKI01010612.1~~GDKI01010612.1.p2  ORF type:complete len:100 (+),score=25.99 GDKI01010612.1:272-571(+)